jgi:hypothetical protein
MGQADRRQSDPMALLTQSMRRIADLRLDDITKGLENFANPSARGMLDSLGRTRDGQIESLAAMLRNSSEDEINEMGMIFGAAMSKLAEERAAGTQGPQAEDRFSDERPSDRPRRGRGQTAAERRQQRRLAY